MNLYIQNLQIIYFFNFTRFDGLGYDFFSPHLEKFIAMSFGCNTIKVASIESS